MRRITILAFCYAFFAIGVGESVDAATLDFTGTLGVNIFGWRDLTGSVVYLNVSGAGSARVTDDGSLHLL